MGQDMCVHNVVSDLIPQVRELDMYVKIIKNCFDLFRITGKTTSISIVIIGFLKPVISWGFLFHVHYDYLEVDLPRITLLYLFGSVWYHFLTMCCIV